MMGSELWNIRDTPLLENHIKNYLASHPSCINQSPLIGTTRVLLPDTFHLGEGASDKIRKDAASFLSQPFRHVLFCSFQNGQSGSLTTIPNFDGEAYIIHFSYPDPFFDGTHDVAYVLALGSHNIICWQTEA